MDHKIVSLIIVTSLVIILLLITIVHLIQNRLTLNQINNLNNNNIIIKNNTIYFSSLTLRQKIAQMIIIRGDKYSLDFIKLNIGGIFLSKQKSEEEYKALNEKYQNSSKIILLSSTDMEGAWDPFSSNPHKSEKFLSFSEIKNKEDAYNTGLKQGELLKNTGFNLNFAPVAEFEDKAYGGRAFSGSKEEVKAKLESYIQGLQKNVSGTCKHYPGKGMIGNTHLSRDKQTITKDDLDLFNVCFKNNISAIMIGHQIVEGEVNSNARPSSVSKEVIDSLDKQDILIVSDEVNMLGIRSFYIKKSSMYSDLINAGENVILDFSLSPASAYNLILNIEAKVKNGEIDEKQINQSVKKILEFKGYKVV